MEKTQWILTEKWNVYERSEKLVLKKLKKKQEKLWIEVGLKMDWTQQKKGGVDAKVSQ